MQKAEDILRETERNEQKKVEEEKAEYRDWELRFFDFQKLDGGGRVNERPELRQMQFNDEHKTFRANANYYIGLLEKEIISKRIIDKKARDKFIDSWLATLYEKKELKRKFISLNGEIRESAQEQEEMFAKDLIVYIRQLKYLQSWWDNRIEFLIQDKMRREPKNDDK